MRALARVGVRGPARACVGMRGRVFVRTDECSVGHPRTPVFSRVRAHAIAFTARMEMPVRMHARLRACVPA